VYLRRPVLDSFIFSLALAVGLGDRDGIVPAQEIYDKVIRVINDMVKPVLRVNRSQISDDINGIPLDNVVFIV
jgi:hypothetical protein